MRIANARPVERRYEIGFVQLECMRVLTKKTAREETARKLVKPILFNRPQKVWSNLGLSSNLLQFPTAAQTFAAQSITDRIHDSLSRAALPP